MTARKASRRLAALMAVNTIVWFINAAFADGGVFAWVATAASFICCVLLVAANRR